MPRAHGVGGGAVSQPPAHKQTIATPNVRMGLIRAANLRLNRLSHRLVDGVIS